ncbi:MAG: hypothetical protein QMC81_05400 [Thermoanaerobacterales bacterium]|nr:hypothetical protein [Thermoanaerobacterales bacterium]
MPPGFRAPHLRGIKDYFDFLNWYLADLTERYARWEKGEIDPDRGR